MNQLLYIIFGAFLGGLVGWLLAARRKPPVDTRVEEELRQQRTAQDSELTRLRAELTQACSARAAADAARLTLEQSLAEQKECALTAAEQALRDQNKWEQELRGMRQTLEATSSDLNVARAQMSARDMTISELRAEREELTRKLADAQTEFLAIQKSHSSAASELRMVREQLATERQQVEAIQEKFRKDFEAITNKLLVDSSTKFNEQSRKSLDEILSPFKENLGEFKLSLEKTRTETSNHSAVLKEQIGRIGAEAANLTKALKGDVKVLGNWGENMLDQILEKSGLQRDVHFRCQSSGKGCEGEQRFLDVIIDLPEGRHLVIDAKVSLRSYEESVNASDDATRKERCVRHIEALRAHVTGLSKKRYQETHGINAPDFVFMYIPIEGAFFTAVAEDQSLFADALDKNVVLITNSTLLATLRTVAHVWRLAEQQKNAQKIAERGAKLYEKFVSFVEDLEDVGKSLRASQKAWDAASNKLHQGRGNLLIQAEQLKELGVHSDKSFKPELIEQAQIGHETVLRLDS